MFDSLDVVRLVSTEIFVLNKARWMFHLSQTFTDEQKPFWIRLGSWCILSLTELHRWTEAFQRTSWFVVYSISHRFSQMNRDLSANRGNTQTPASRRQISQSVIADVSWKVLWILYAGGVLWDRNCAQKGSVKSVRSVKDKTPHELNSAQKCSVKSVSSVREKPPQRVSKIFFFSQSTQKNRTHRVSQRH